MCEHEIMFLEQITGENLLYTLKCIELSTD